MSEYLTRETFLELWKAELLPSIKAEIQAETQAMKQEFEELRKRMMNIEKSQEFVAAKYDETIEALQSLKKQISTSETEINRQAEEMSSIHDNIEECYTLIDEVQQYSRRDCLEISGIPKLTNDDPKQLVTELSALTGVVIQDGDISTAHRLPDTKNNKNRIIVKFVKRDKKDELYSKRRQLVGKSTKDLPSVFAVDQESKSRIYINESLTSYRRKLLGKINQFKKENGFKFLWTNNGKIMLKKHDTAKSFGFTNEMDFEEFVNKQ